MKTMRVKRIRVLKELLTLRKTCMVCGRTTINDEFCKGPRDCVGVFVNWVHEHQEMPKEVSPTLLPNGEYDYSKADNYIRQELAKLNIGPNDEIPDLKYKNRGIPQY